MGAIVDLGGTIVAAIVMALAYSTYLTSRGVPGEQVQQTLESAPIGSAYFNIAVAVGVFFSALGGYVCAAYARKNTYQVGLVLAAIVSMIGLTFGGQGHSELFDTLTVVVTVAAVMSGTWFHTRKDNRKQA
jgi:uncharacterized membrane protein